MKYAPIPVVFAALLLAGCGQPPSVDALAADPSRLHTLRTQCRAGERDGAFCAHVVRADLRRFLSGTAGPTESRTLADLPPISPSFDEPEDGSEAVAQFGPEDSP